MSTAKRKSPVRIVCPHCQRSYVIQVDLQRIFRTSPRAICARCGKRFDVIQRMAEIEETEAAEAAERRRDGEPGPPRGLVEHVTPPRHRSPPERPKPARSSSEPSHAADADAEAPSEGRVGKGDRAGLERARDAEPPLPLRANAEQPRDPGGAPARRWAPSAPAPPPAPAPVQGAAPPPRLQSSTPQGDLGPPAASDLDRPLPWVDSSPARLELEGRALPESAEALERLLDEHEPSRKAG